MAPDAAFARLLAGALVTFGRDFDMQASHFSEDLVKPEASVVSKSVVMVRKVVLYVPHRRVQCRGRRAAHASLASHADALARQEPGKRAGHGLRPGKMAIPTTYTDHNILSNIPFDEHHWAPPEQRPRAQQRQGKQRLVPVGNLKEYNIVSNRYLEHHDEKMYRDKEITLREAAQKCRRERRYDPLLQRRLGAQAA